MKAAARAQTGFPEFPDEKVTPISHVTISVSRNRWSYAADNAGKIARFWKKASEENPRLHDGQVFVLTRWQIEGDRFEGEAEPTSFASFLYWRDQGYPEVGARNCFGSAVLRSQESHLLFGHMASHTSTSGLVYPVGGSFGIEDLRDGMLDVDLNISREMKEETGLDPADAVRVPGYLCVQEGPRISLAAIFKYDLSSADLRRRIIYFLDSTEDPELDDIVVFRRSAYVRHHRMPAYARMLVEHLISG